MLYMKLYKIRIRMSGLQAETVYAYGKDIADAYQDVLNRFPTCIILNYKRK